MPDDRHRGAFVNPGTVDPDELEANLFAVELLMPEPWLRRDCRMMFDIAKGQRGPRFDIEYDPRIEQLADRYQVSVQLMTIRLIDLGLL